MTVNCNSNLAELSHFFMPACTLSLSYNTPAPWSHSEELLFLLLCQHLNTYTVLVCCDRWLTLGPKPNPGILLLDETLDQASLLRYKPTGLTIPFETPAAEGQVWFHPSACLIGSPVEDSEFLPRLEHDFLSLLTSSLYLLKLKS